MPFKLSSAMVAAGKLDKEIDDIKNDIDKVERDDTKFGFEDDLFILRDSCHSIKSGK
jgi:hypothetical protein